ncbi:MAG: type II toxin-antitoxin system HipA family toxin [Mariprofundus sp.]
MVEKVDTATVRIWGRDVGVVSWLAEREYAVFEYFPEFLRQGLDLAPIHMGINTARNSSRIFQFPALSKDTFAGLPGMLADSLPDKFGNAIIEACLARNGRDIGSFSPVERLCYIGNRGMGALEFYPSTIKNMDNAVPVEMAPMVELMQRVLNTREQLEASFGHDENSNAQAIRDILRVGTSAGGARSKAIIAMNAAGDVVSGQADIPKGYEHWMIKFDGVDDIELGKSRSYGRIEYAYYLMAKSAGIAMTDCRLLEEGGRAHFLTRRFDRVKGRKIHLQSLCSIAHYDFNMAGAYSYEQTFMQMRRLKLSKADAEQQYRRMIFNVIARNQDDHTKNIAFLMTQGGQWQLSPAFDVTYSHNLAGQWTSQHQMSIAGKRDGFTRQDLIEVGKSISLKQLARVIDEVIDAISRWPEFAKQANVSLETIRDIAGHHRLSL